jgi:hypothetical protein
MIDITIPGTKAPRWFQGSTPQVKHTNMTALTTVNSIQQEALRRHAICKRLAHACEYKAGDVVEVIDAANEDIGKKFKVLSICDSYALMGKNEKWPPGDNPMLVHIADIEAPNASFFCTTNYVRKVA